jgi:hypothetical protein
MTLSPDIDKTIKHLVTMSDVDLTQILHGIQAILEARAEKNPAETEPVERQSGYFQDSAPSAHSRRGYYELKEINGHFYWYLRWRDGQKLRSHYIGKEKPF